MLFVIRRPRNATKGTGFIIYCDRTGAGARVDLC